MPAPRYHIIDDFVSDKPTSASERAAIRYVSYSPYGIVAVFPVALPASADRTKMGIDDGGKTKSISTDAADGVRLRYPPLVITGDLEMIQTQEQKGSPASSLSVKLSHSTINYFSAVLPGDWVMAWICPSEEIGRDVVARIERMEPCNGFRDGLRFVGKVQDVLRDTASRGDGLNDVTYQIVGAGFTELEAQIFYDPYLAESTPLMGTWLARLNQAISELLGKPSDDAASSAAIDINRVVPFLFNMLLGEGISKRFANPGDDPELEGRVVGLRQGSGEAPFALTVPGEVGLILGKRARSRGTVPAYADIVELLTGVQRWTNSAGRNAPVAAPWANFIPDGVEPPPEGETQVPSRKTTGTKLLGQFIPTIPDFTNKPIWTVLRQFLNPAINEMFACLRTNEAGQVVPTVVVRQIPLSSEIVTERVRQSKNLTLTPMLEVPRWVGHPTITKRRQERRTDSLRFNFVHVYGQSPTSQAPSRFTYQIVRSPPARNDLDVQRSGMRPYMAMVTCSIDEERTAAATWIGICSDWLLDQQMTIGASAQLELVPAPIAIGDNYEYLGVVSQIEGISHYYAVSNGKKSAGTNLFLTHGVRSDDDPGYQDRSQGDAYIFSGTLESDMTAYEPSAWVSEERPEPRYANTAKEAELPGDRSEDPEKELDDLLKSLP